MKKFLATVLACALVLSMTACGGTTSSDSTATSASTGTAADTSADTSADSAATVDAGDSAAETAETIEEIPYTLGGDLTPTMIAESIYNEGNKVRLAGVIKKLQAGEEITVAYLGGSITNGTSAGNDLCYARLTTNWLEEQFPDAKINYVNAGIGGTGSYIGVHRCDTDVLSYNPDLVFVEYSVNDTTERTEINKQTYESLLNKIWSYETNPAIITIAMTQENGTSFQEYHGEIVKKYDLPMISYKNVILDVIDKGYIQWAEISDDNIHPNVPGHALLSQLITHYIQSVIDTVDTISGDESDFSIAGDSANKYKDAKFLNSDNTTAASLGDFEVKATGIGGFNNPWVARSSDGTFTYGIEFEVEAMNIGILYGKVTSNGALADVYIDGSLVKTLDSDFSGGWGNYAEFEEISTFMEKGTHTVKIVPKNNDDGSAAIFYVAAIAVS